MIFLGFGLFALMFNDMKRMEPETLVLCILGDGGIRIPGPLCEAYLYRFRDVQSDVELLSEGAGLGFILEGRDKDKKYQLAEFFINHGLSVNGPNQYGGYRLTPMHGAILENDLEMTQFLLRMGADINIRSSFNNVTPLELAKVLQEQDPNIDRGPIITLLERESG